MSHASYLNPFDDDQLEFTVLVNSKRQYSLWPVFADRPAGWETSFGPASRGECLDHIERVWTNINPFSIAK